MLRNNIISYVSGSLVSCYYSWSLHVFLRTPVSADQRSRLSSTNQTRVSNKDFLCAALKKSCRVLKDDLTKVTSFSLMTRDSVISRILACLFSIMMLRGGRMPKGHQSETLPCVCLLLWGYLAVNARTFLRRGVSDGQLFLCFFSRLFRAPAPHPLSLPLAGRLAWDTALIVFLMALDVPELSYNKILPTWVNLGDTLCRSVCKMFQWAHIVYEQKSIWEIL